MMDAIEPEALAAIRLLPTNEGGREQPFLPPHFTCPLQFGSEMFTVRLYYSKPVAPGESFVAHLKFLAPELVKPWLRPAVDFTLWEGRTIAMGKVMESIWST